MKKFHQLLMLFIISFIFVGCKKENVKEDVKVDVYKSSFTLNGDGQRFYTPIAYIKMEGYDNIKKIYYLSLILPTGSVIMDTISKNLKGAGEAIQFYFYAPSQKEVPIGKYNYTNPLNTSNLFLQIQKIYTYTNNYSFTYTQNQKGISHTITKIGTLNVSKSGEIYDITYSFTMTYKDINLKQYEAYYQGDYKGKIVFP